MTEATAPSSVPSTQHPQAGLQVGGADAREDGLAEPVEVGLDPGNDGVPSGGQAQNLRAPVARVFPAPDETGRLQLVEEADQRRSLDSHRLGEGVLARLTSHAPDQDQRQRLRLGDPMRLRRRIGEPPPLAPGEQKRVGVGQAQLAQSLVGHLQPVRLAPERPHPRPRNRTSRKLSMS
ncbi:hypothetical protein GPNCGGLF_LOCUS1193 [Methylorubrum aminovorans]